MKECQGSSLTEWGERYSLTVNREAGELDTWPVRITIHE